MRKLGERLFHIIYTGQQGTKIKFESDRIKTKYISKPGQGFSEGDSLDVESYKIPKIAVL